MTKLFLILLTFTALNSFAQKNDYELLNADKKFAALSYSKGVGVAFENYLAEDAVFLSTTALPIEGKKEFMKLFSNTKSTVIWQPTGSFKDSGGTSGYTYGLSKWIYPIADSLSFSYYVYHTSWLKDKAGQWKVTTDIGTEITLDKLSLVSKDSFKYSKNTKPIIEKTIKEKKCKVVYFSFHSDRKGIVPAILVKPLKGDIKTAVFYQHGIGDNYNKEYFLEEAKKLAENGIASLLIDAPFKRKGNSYIANGGMNDAQIIENNCIEWLQATNLLPKLGVKPKNFIFAGQSYGARVAALMPYLDNRFKKIIIMNGIYNYAEWMQTTTVNQIVELRKNISPVDFKNYIKSVAGYDASIYLNKKNDLDFYFQMSDKDEDLSDYDFLSCYEMTNAKKKLVRYDTNHDLNKKAIEDRINQIILWANEENTSH